MGGWSECIVCTKVRAKKYYLRHKDKLRAYSKKYRLKNIDKIKEWELKNKDKTSQRNKKYRLENKGKVSLRHKKYIAENRDKRNQYRKEKYQNDINYKIESTLRSRIHMALKGNVKSLKTIELIGCSISFFKKYIESKFKTGMTWDNHGYYGWHIDHIRPCASFDLTDPEQQKQCFNYKNMQPMWGEENMKKGKKFFYKGKDV